MTTFSRGFAFNTNNMKKSILTFAMAAICGSAMAQDAICQLPNSDFESKFVQGYKVRLTTTSEPLNWHGYPTMNGSFTNTTFGRPCGDKLRPSDEVRPGSYGTKSVYIKATEVGGVLANGVMTSGRVNSSSITPDDPANNYNYSPGGSYTANKNQNKDFDPDFTGKPDAMKVWVKFVANDATKNSEYPYASVNAVLHNSNTYQDPEVKGNDYSNIKIAGASNLKIGENNGYDKWTELTLPFTYYNTAEDQEPAYMLISFSTNAQPGKGTVGDMLFIDDLEFIYYSELKTATYDNESLDFSTSNQVNINKVYDPALLKVTSNGEGATISRNYDAATGLLTITIKGNDIAENEDNYHTYKIQFAAPRTSKKYDAGLAVTVNGSVYLEQESSINIYEMSNDTYMMQLSNFVLGGATPIGNIVLTGLKANASKIGMISFVSKQTIQISEGTDETYAGLWGGPSLGDVPVVFEGKMTDNRFFCNIDIDMSTMGQKINVVFGKDFTVVYDQQAVTADEAGTKDVILNRSFAQGWNTICLPFNVKPTEIAEGAKAQEFFSVNANALNFAEVAEMQANTPYLFFAPQAIASGKVLENKNVVEGVAKSVTKEGYTFCGTYTLTDMQGKYGVANVEGVQKIMRGAAGSSLAGTRAYFTTTNTKANGMRINLGDNGITGINQINAENVQNAAAVYNLQGVKVSNHGTTNLPAGIYIMQGKKVIVK